MQQLTKSLGSFTWAVSLFGVQQVASALGSKTSQSDSNRAIEALEEVTRVSLDQCGSSVREAFEMGDRIQRGLIDMVFRLIPIGQGVFEPCGCDDPIDMWRDESEGRSKTTANAHTAPANEEELGWGPVPANS